MPALAASSSSAQDTVKVSGDALDCPACVITLDTVLTLGGLDGPGLDAIDMASRVAVDRLGRILISVYRLPEISVFDSAGTFLRTFGRSGEGPGEYLYTNHVSVGSEHIHVFDMRGRTVLDYDFEVVRVDRFAAERAESHVLGSGDVAFPGIVPTPASAGHPIHVLTLAGEMTSFGGQGAAYVYGDQEWAYWDITGDAKSLWVVENPHANRLTRWDLEAGDTTWKVYDRMMEEFDRHAGTADGASSEIVDAGLDDRGLWVVWRTPDRFWIDLVDPVTGGTVARDGGHDQPIGLFGYKEAPESSYLFLTDESDAGIPYIRLVEIGLSSPGKARGR